jgi:hypothetical protein
MQEEALGVEETVLNTRGMEIKETWKAKIKGNSFSKILNQIEKLQATPQEQ